MQHDRNLATRHLLLALLDAQEVSGEVHKNVRSTLPTLVSAKEDSSPFTLREGLFHEPKTMPGFARARSKSR